jgi:hypothetical protein
MEKQIEEMAKIMCHGCFRRCDDTSGCIVEDYAEDIYTAGYRKQSEGEWIWTENGEADYEKYWVCSVCKEHDFVKTKFCSNCGAKMKGEKDGKSD